MLRDLLSWLAQPAVVWGLAAFSIAATVLGAVFVPRFLAGLPADYLRSGGASRKPALPLRVLQNAAGALLVLLGLVMLVMPGPGILTLLVGLLLLDFPGKRGLVVRLLTRPKVLATVNKLRLNRGAVPLTA